jgi:hypothetical protein
MSLGASLPLEAAQDRSVIPTNHCQILPPFQANVEVRIWDDRAPSDCMALNGMRTYVSSSIAIIRSSILRSVVNPMVSTKT